MRDKNNHIKLNDRIAIIITRYTGSMWTAYIFAFLSLMGLFGLLGLLNPFVFLLTTWISQQFLQLVLLPIILVGQNISSSQQQAKQEKALRHLEEQDKKILDQDNKMLVLARKIDAQSQRIEIILEHLEKAKSSHE